MSEKHRSFTQYAGLFLTLHLILFRCANGEGICTKLKYGKREDDYMPVLDKYCCPGYGGANSNQCLPRCDMGCPSNSYCVIPNVCDCEAGYEIDETFIYFGLQAIKSCRSKSFASPPFISVAISGVTIIVIVIVLVVLVKYLRRRQKDPYDSNLDQRQGKGERHTMV